MLNSMEKQLDQFKEQAAQAGFSGTAIMDIQPRSGIIRLKLSITPPEGLKMVTRNFSQVMAMMLGGMNVQVKIHVQEEAQ